jgi:hypothetical protein
MATVSHLLPYTDLQYKKPPPSYFRSQPSLTRWLGHSALFFVDMLYSLSMFSPSDSLDSLRPFLACMVDVQLIDEAIPEDLECRAETELCPEIRCFQGGGKPRTGKAFVPLYSLFHLFNA